MFAAADTLITLLIFAAIAIISSWLKRRQPGDESGAPPPPRPGAPPPKTRTTNWEEELRRLLEGEETATPPTLPRPAPKPRAAPRPPPIPKAPRPVAEPAGEMDRGLAVDLPKLVESGRSYERARQLERKVGDFMRQRAGLSASASAHARASHLEARVAERFRQVTEETTKMSVPGRERRMSSEALTVRGMFRERQSARAAVLAAVVLGPPKGLAE